MKIKVIEEPEIRFIEGTLWVDPEEDEPLYLLVKDGEKDKGYKAYNIKGCRTFWGLFSDNPEKAVSGLIPFRGKLEISNE